MEAATARFCGTCGALLEDPAPPDPARRRGRLPATVVTVVLLAGLGLVALVLADGGGGVDGDVALAPSAPPGSDEAASGSPSAPAGPRPACEGVAGTCPVWSRPAAGRTLPATAGVVVTVDGSRVIGVDVDDGGVAWDLRLPAPPLVLGGDPATVVLRHACAAGGTCDDRTVAVATDDGTVLWGEADLATVSGVVAAGDLVLTGDRTDEGAATSLVARDRLRGDARWRWDAPPGIGVLRVLDVDDDAVLLQEDATTLTRLDRADGRVVWRLPAGGVLASDEELAVASRGTATDRGGPVRDAAGRVAREVVAVALDEGEVTWRHPITSRSLEVVLLDRLVVAVTEDATTGLDRRTGEVAWAVASGGRPAVRRRADAGPFSPPGGGGPDLVTLAPRDEVVVRGEDGELRWRRSVALAPLQRVTTDTAVVALGAEGVVVLRLATGEETYRVRSAAATWSGSDPLLVHTADGRLVRLPGDGGRPTAG